MSRLANWFVSLADRWARWRQRRGFDVEPRVIISPRGPKLRYEKPESNDERGWDKRHYERGNIHFQGYYNPVQFTAQEAADTETGSGVSADGGFEKKELNEVGILPSTNFKTALMANDVIPKALNPEPFDDIKRLVLASLGVSALAAIGVIYVATVVG